MKARVIMIMRRLYAASAVLRFLEQDEPSPAQLRPWLVACALQRVGQGSLGGARQEAGQGETAVAVLALGALVIYHLARLSQHERGLPGGQGIKPLSLNL
jgi:hypothetical protein